MVLPHVVLCARCHLDALFVVRRGLLATSSFVEGRPLVPSFANVIGVLPLLQAFEFLSCTLDESIAQAPLHCCHHHLLYLILIALLMPLLRGISPVYSIEHIPNYRFIEMFMKLPFQ